MKAIRQKAQIIERLRKEVSFSATLLHFGEVKLEIRRIEALIDHELQSVLPIDLSLAEVLFCFLSEPVGASITPSAIINRLGLPPTTITSRLRRLESLDLILRETTDADRRSLRALLTEKGEETLLAAVDIYSRVVEDSFSITDAVSKEQKR